MKKNIEYAILVKSETRQESLVNRFNTVAQAKFYINSLGGSFKKYRAEHDNFHYSLEAIQKKLSNVVKYKIVGRAYLPNYIFSDSNLIIVIGQDGLVANTAKYAKGLPIVAVNPDKQQYDGVLLPFDASNFVPAVEKVLANNYKSRTVRLAEAKLNDGQRLLAFNDLFIGASSHVSARYRITFNQQTENHSSSGIIVSTKVGSTGWLSSIFNMAYGVANLFEENLQPKQPTLEDDQLLFAVREPFKSLKTQIGITAGIIQPQQQLTIESFMPNNGVIFSDGIHQDYIKFNSGAIATVGLAKETANLVYG